jgi:hypothetical protein
LTWSLLTPGAVHEPDCALAPELSEPRQAVSIAGLPRDSNNVIANMTGRLRNNIGFS